ncbi:MAG: polyprenyl synthetase family protein [Verrucomicrobiae bacterium]|nr:polyprenyl synthetase family protein [Verrucomicrobiae bacterium]
MIPTPSQIKEVPQDLRVRESIRVAAAGHLVGLMQGRTPGQAELERQGRELLASLSLPDSFLGFAMVCLNNCFWEEAFGSTPFRRRLLLLPECLSDRTRCRGERDADGIRCVGCCSCGVERLRKAAEARGYQVVVTEGTGTALDRVLNGGADAVLGVACMDSLEKSFVRVAGLGAPHLAIPLLRNGCKQTEVEEDEVLRLLGLEGGNGMAAGGMLPLWRETTMMFASDAVEGMLGACLGKAAMERPMMRLALEWLNRGGKRIRPFVTLAAFAGIRHGETAFSPGGIPDGGFPVFIRLLALAIECMHKASLIHDDVEDEDGVRYGRPTLHREHGVPVAVNAGDFLVGLGYRLVAEAGKSLDDRGAMDILACLTRAHLALCEGQGAELLSLNDPWRQSSADVLEIYGLKTAPAFEAALVIGARAADVRLDPDMTRRFFLQLGAGFQILNDREEWENPALRHRLLQHLFQGTPTIFTACLSEAGQTERARRLLDEWSNKRMPDEQAAEQLKAWLAEAGAFAKADELVDRFAGRARRLIDVVEQPGLRLCLDFLIRLALGKEGGRQV